MREKAVHFFFFVNLYYRWLKYLKMCLQNENTEGNGETQQRGSVKELSGYSWQATQNQNCILR